MNTSRLLADLAHTGTWVPAVFPADPGLSEDLGLFPWRGRNRVLSACFAGILGAAVYRR